MGSYIRAAGLNGFEELVRSYGKDPTNIFDRIGLIPSVIREPNSLIDHDKYINLLELAAIVCNEECFGLKLGAKQSIQTIGLIGVYMSKQTDIAKALLVAQKYIYSHAESFVFQINEVSDKLCELDVVRQNAQNIDRAQKSQLSICLICNILKDLIGPKWRPEKVRLKQNPSPQSKKLLTQVLGCPVEFNTKKNAIYFSTVYLSYKPHYFEDNLVNQLIVQQLENENSTCTHDDIFLIESSMKMLLATADCSMANVALCVGQHPKKVQRQLKNEGTTYRDLLEEVRKKEAVRIINTGDVSLTDVAFQLGYAELSVFSRQFKSWFGITPTEWKDSSKVLVT
ncbi:AraC family transcriptional regulator ligand-binding domain-containing protein [Psychrobacter sp. APC 3281]|uniref:AraC family transcriptional regulator n=1 Tax=unclassified Psychrobacter TaxID=196806 RepID=UPI0008A669C5|nr:MULTISPECIES: AraC family transcriptional regulator [unclassified Psychrobacter]AOY43025.1 AraC family transcriptional regulator [Psychrobacter sp. AntiMn-1]MDN3446385.1 AraC family transcriptional regulator ligand-binding domain-containing protein [Psychrobacter sp. APC 3281]